MKTFRTLLIFLCSALTYAQTSSADLRTVSGLVVDSQGRAIASAHVRLIQSQMSKTTDATADPAGHFVFPSVSPGQYQLKAMSAGFETATQQIDVNTGEQHEFTLSLRVAPVQTALTVQGEREGLVVPTATAGSLTPVSLLDLPQSVQVVNRTLLDPNSGSWLIGTRVMALIR